MIELEPRTLEVYGAGSKSFIEIEGFTRKTKQRSDGEEITFRNQLAHHEWVEASKGQELFPAIVIAAWLHYLDLIVSNPDYLWRYIYYRKDHERKSHDLSTT